MMIKIGLVGCGRISQNHVNAILYYKNDLLLTAVCDTDESAMQAKFIPEQVKRYTHYLELVNDPNVDLIIICTPSGLHPQQAIIAAQHKKHVLSEKPMATNWQEGLDMVKACKDANVQLFIVKQNRCNPTVKLIKEAVDHQYFGQIYMVSCNVFWCRPQSYYDQAKWRGTWALDGGALMNQASHYVDLMQWLIEPVKSVQAMSATLARNIEAEDSAVVNLRYQSGALGSMSVTMLTYPKNLEGSITIIGEKGTVRLGGMALNEITHWEFQDNPMQLTDAQKFNYEIANVYGQGHVEYYKNVIQTLKGESQALTDGEQGLRSLKLLTAIYESAKQGQLVNL